MKTSAEQIAFLADKMADALFNLLEKLPDSCPEGRSVLYQYRQATVNADGTTWAQTLEQENKRLRDALYKVQKASTVSRAIIIAQLALQD